MASLHYSMKDINQRITLEYITHNHHLYEALPSVFPFFFHHVTVSYLS